MNGEPDWKLAAEYALRDAALCESHGNLAGAETYRLEAQDYLAQVCAGDGGTTL